MRFLIIALLAFIQPLFAGFDSKSQGTTAAKFLQLGSGARAMAMGETATALSSDASGLYWNPASLAAYQKRSIIFMHGVYVDSSYFDYSAYSQKITSRSALGFGAQYFSAGKITQTDSFGIETGNFTPSDFAVSAGYAYRLRGVAIGLSGKFIQSKLISSAETMAADIGALFFINSRINMALTASNIGGKMQFDREKENLPLIFKYGTAIKFNSNWTLGADIGAPRDNKPYLALGTELRLDAGSLEFFPRAGFNSRTQGNAAGTTEISFGVGIGGGGIHFDHAFIPMGGLGPTHWSSISFKF